MECKNRFTNFRLWIFKVLKPALQIIYHLKIFQSTFFPFGMMLKAIGTNRIVRYRMLKVRMQSGYMPTCTEKKVTVLTQITGTGEPVKRDRTVH